MRLICISIQTGPIVWNYEKTNSRPRKMAPMPKEWFETSICRRIVKYDTYTQPTKQSRTMACIPMVIMFLTIRVRFSSLNWILREREKEILSSVYDANMCVKFYKIDSFEKDSKCVREKSNRKSRHGSIEEETKLSGLQKFDNIQ